MNENLATAKRLVDQQGRLVLCLVLIAISCVISLIGVVIGYAREQTELVYWCSSWVLISNAIIQVINYYVQKLGNKAISQLNIREASAS